MENTIKEDYDYINIDDIIINPQNPRHDPIIGECGEVFVMKQLISTKKEAKAMYKLIKDIYENNWYKQSIITVTYEKDKDKYLAWDGNRRTTAMKLLKNPKLLENFKEVFSFEQINEINKMNKGIKDKSFYAVPCFRADSFDACKDYIRNIHTNDTGALRWSQTAIKRFENEVGNENVFCKLQEVCPKAFDSIGRNFRARMFEKLVSSKIGKEYLDIKYEEGVLTVPKNLNTLNGKIKQIIIDLNNGKIVSDTIKNNVNIHKYLYDNDNNKFKKLNSDNKQDANSKEENEKEEYNNQIDINDYIYANLKKENKFNNNNSNVYKIKLIRKRNGISFKNINLDKLNNQNERAKGIRNLCSEIQKMSFESSYKKYSISYCFLIRSLLEQTSIYFLINKNKWDKYIKANNNKELKLENIIKNINKDKDNLILDKNVNRIWSVCFDTDGLKNYLDLVIHHPELVVADNDVIEKLTNIGLFTVIQYFIDEK